MGKVPVRLKEVVYTVSPFEVTILNGLFKDFPKKVQKNLREVSAFGRQDMGMDTTSALTQKFSTHIIVRKLLTTVAVALCRKAGTSRCGAWRPSLQLCGERCHCHYCYICTAASA